MVVNSNPESQCNGDNRKFLELYVSTWQSGFYEHNGQVFVDCRDASQMTRIGFDALEWGHTDLARECMSLALPQLLEDLGPNGPEETAATFVPLNGPRIEPGRSVGEAVTWGWSAEMKATWWICVGLCRWVLENRHDAESFNNAGDCLYRWVKPAIEGRYVDTRSLCEYTPVFVAAGQFDRAMGHFRAAPKFKPPRAPGNARSQRAMAYALCLRHERLRGSEQIAREWASFFRAIVFTRSDKHLGLGENKALWIKMRYWDDVAEPTRLTAVEAYRRFVEDDGKAQ